jgi:hypothetical protein
VENPTYDKARLDALEFFQREGMIKGLLAELKDSALKRFEKVTGQAFNTQAPGGLEILLGVVQLVPEAGPLLTTLGHLKGGKKFVIKMKTLAKDVAERGEELESIKKVGQGGVELAGKGSEATEEHEAAEFVIEKINNLDELRVDTVDEQLDTQNRIDALLEAHEYDPPEVDLKALVKQQLGPIDRSSVKNVRAEVGERFELGLYKDFYKHTKKAAFVENIAGVEGIVPLPREAQKHILGLGKKHGIFSTEREMAADWGLPTVTKGYEVLPGTGGDAEK